MWHQSTKETAERSITDVDKCGQLDSGYGDSGFLSSSNLASAELSSDLDSKSKSIPIVASVVEPMRAADSGLDLGLSESLSRLSLTKLTLKPNDSNIAVKESSLNLIPLNAKDKDSQVKKEEQSSSDSAILPSSVALESWEIYYIQDDEGDTQLHIAIVQGFVEAAFSLIRMAPHPCLLNILNDDGQTALHLAVLTRQSNIARRLVLAGADLTSRTFQGNTALHLVCESGDVSCVRALTDPVSNSEREYLLTRKRLPAIPQNLEIRNYIGKSCLHVAASNGHVEIVRLLLRLGADLEAREGLNGMTALHIAVMDKCKPIIDFLLNECRPNFQSETYAGLTAYQVALLNHNYELARELVAHGAKPQPLPEMDYSDEEFENDELQFDEGYTRIHLTRYKPSATVLQC